jgi:hypothetical protein
MSTGKHREGEDMRKDAYYFSHDTNARRDPKILAMISEFGAEGYGIYWMVIEMLAEQEGYKLEHKKWVSHAIAMETQCERNTVVSFIEKGIEDYELFKSDGEYFWSESLLRRMEIKDSKRKKRSEAGKAGALARWGKEKKKEDNKEWQSHGNRMADAYERNADYSKGKERKEKESKEKEIRSKYKFETHHMKLAELLFKKIQENNPNAKKPSLESWANTFRLMMERDEREGKEIQHLILWTQQHHFWYKNILSADKLRKQYDRLLLEMKDDNKAKVIGGESNGTHRRKPKTSYEGTDVAELDFNKRRIL